MTLINEQRSKFLVDTARTHQGSGPLGCPALCGCNRKITPSSPEIILFDHDSFKDTIIQDRRRCAGTLSPILAIAGKPTT